MDKAIGFGTPENPETKWEKSLGAGTVVYIKRRENGAFLYNCQYRRGDSTSSTGIHLSRELTKEEVEQLPQFIEFLARM
jgi:hypothetical protein